MVRVLLDNGHGVETPGKRSPRWDDGRQLLEWEFNRDVVARVKNRLDSAGIACEVLVPEAVDVSIAERCRRANRWAAEGDCLLISIHANAGGGTGGEVFTYPGATASQAYARVFQEHWAEHLPEFPYRGDKVANFGILRGSRCAAVLVETLFMDNAKDCEVLLSPEGRERIARWIAASIREIIARFFNHR